MQYNDSRVPQTLYVLSATLAQIIRPKVAPDNTLIPTLGYVDREQCVEDGIKAFLCKNFAVESITVQDAEWTVIMKPQSRLLTKAQLSLNIVYVFETQTLLEHQWRSTSPDTWSTVQVLREFSKRTRVQLYEYFLERKLTIRHPRMQ